MLLPPRQAALLNLLNRYRAESHVPTIRELADALGVASQNAVVDLLAKLEAKGVIEREANRSRSIRVLPQYSVEHGRQLPLIGRIAAGLPITAGEHVAEILDLSPSLFDPPANLLFRVQGESMLNAGIRPNDLVGVHLQDEVRSGQIVAAVITDPRTDDPELTLKRLRRKGSIVTLLSENDDQSRYPPLVFDTRRDAIQLVGVYCGLVRPRP